VAGTPLVVPLTLQPFGATAAVNFVPFVKAVGAGSYSSYALLSDGTVRAWGHNGVGQLGDGTVTHRSTPVAVSGLSGVASLATNGQGYHSCAVKTGGSAWCWGWNAYGQLGNNTTTSSSVPVAVTGGYLFRQISQGYSHACGVTTSGYVTCWGSNWSGQFGNYTSTSSLVPIAPMYPLIAAVEEVQCGASFSCVRGGNQEVACTGDNSSGELGTGNTTSTNYWTASSLRTPATLPAGIGLGAYHACAVVPVDGSMRCVGDNEFGELGDGTTTDRYSAVAVSGLAAVTAIAAGNYFTCALKSDGTVWCWGYNYYGELGDRTEVSHSTPAPVYGLSQVVSIAAGETHVCVAKADGTAWCWGQNANGELGDATMTNRAQPAKVVF
jgi:alpha-tubulin suppressor-like RCC1 family protein